MQISTMVEFILGKGFCSFGVDHIKSLFKAADMVSPRSGKSVSPSPKEIKRRVDKALIDGNKSFSWSENAQQWCISDNRFSLHFRFILRATDRFKASDTITKLAPFHSVYGLEVDSEELDSNWAIDVKLPVRYSSFPAARSHTLDVLSELSDKWQIKFSKNQLLSGESSSLNNSKIKSCIFELLKTNE